MQIILGIIFIVLLAFVISKLDILTPRQKTVIFTILMMILSAAILYEFMFSKTEQNNRKLINAFIQGKTLVCKQSEVTQADYILERGTNSFMAKSSNKKIIGTIQAVEDCTIKE